MKRTVQTRRGMLGFLAGSIVAPLASAFARTASPPLPDVPALLFSTRRLSIGSRVATSNGYVYEVARLDAADSHLITAGGTKLYALPGPDDSFNLEQFYTVDAGVALQRAILAADGRKVIIPAGLWELAGIDVTGAWIEFQPGAVIRGTVGAGQNVLNTKGGTRLIRPVLEVANSGAPVDGGLGNIITMGAYSTDGAVYDGLEIVDGTFTCRNSNRFGFAISCLGRCENVRLRGTTILRGRFAGGFQAHWGGDFNGDSHRSEVSTSYHPNDIYIERLQLERGGPSTLGGHLGLSLSAAYDVKVDTLINRGWDRTDWIQPGDVYDLVAAPDQRDKVMSGIAVRYTEVTNPVAATGDYSNVLVSGVSATIRVAGQSEVVCAADRQNMEVDHGEIVFVCEGDHSYNAIPLARMIYAKNSRMKVIVPEVLALNRGTASVIHAVCNSDCEIVATSGCWTPYLVSGYGNIRVTYLLERHNLDPRSSINHRVIALGQTGGTAKVGGDAPKGSVTIAIAGWSRTSPGLVLKDTRLYLTDGTFVVLSRSQMMGSGTNRIDVQPIPVAISASTVLSVTCKELDSTITGALGSAPAAIELMNCDGVAVPSGAVSGTGENVILTGTNRRLKLSSTQRL